MVQPIDGINNIVKPLRIQKKLSAERLARVCETTRQTIINIETGKTKNPGYDLVVKISDALGEPMDKIFFTDRVKQV